MIGQAIIRNAESGFERAISKAKIQPTRIAPKNNTIEATQQENAAIANAFR